MTLGFKIPCRAYQAQINLQPCTYQVPQVHALQQAPPTPEVTRRPQPYSLRMVTRPTIVIMLHHATTVLIAWYYWQRSSLALNHRLQASLGPLICGVRLWSHVVPQLFVGCATLAIRYRRDGRSRMALVACRSCLDLLLPDCASRRIALRTCGAGGGIKDGVSSHGVENRWSKRFQLTSEVEFVKVVLSHARLIIADAATVSRVTNSISSTHHRLHLSRASLRLGEHLAPL